MTVLVGILCSDGVVIGCDSAMAAGRVGQYTIERQEGVFKIEVPDVDIITAFTGATGLSQRFNGQLLSTLKMLKAQYNGPVVLPGIGRIPDPIQDFLMNRFKKGSVPFNGLNAVELGRVLAQAVISDFETTRSTLQNANGWGLGALFAFIKDDAPHLIEFDGVQFHPELKGMPDPQRAGLDRTWRAVSMGAGKLLADAFLAHAYRLLFGEKTPTVERAKLAIIWTIDHVKRYNTGLVGGQSHLAVLEKVDGSWTAHHEDTGQVAQQMDELEKYIGEFRRTPDAAAKDAIDLDAELDPAKTAPSEQS